MTDAKINPYQSPAEGEPVRSPSVHLEGAELIKHCAFQGALAGAVAGLVAGLLMALCVYCLLPTSIPQHVIDRLNEHGGWLGFVAETSLAIPLETVIFSSLGGMIWGGAVAWFYQQGWVESDWLGSMLPRDAAIWQGVAYALIGYVQVKMIAFNVYYFGRESLGDLELSFGAIVCGLVGGGTGGYHCGRCMSNSIMTVADDGVPENPNEFDASA